MKVNDLVTRKKYNNDIIFRIKKINGNEYTLQGINLRLVATAYKEDLVKINEINIKEEKLVLEEVRNSKIRKGIVLHLDGDEVYLNKSLKVYKENDVEVYGYYIPEKEMKNVVTNLLIKHKPDILVITGHDAKNDFGEYLNTDNFALCVKNARIVMPDKDSLVIFAGACQTSYEKMIDSGANFASSINQNNIHVLDPVYIAIQVALTPIREYVDVDKVLKNTISKSKGLGGIDTRGVARKTYGG